jgi:hypothetical protein
MKERASSPLNQRIPKPDENSGRLMLGVGGLLFIPLVALGTYGLFFELPRPQGPAEWGIRLLLGELAISGMAFFSLGFLWAFSGNRRLKRLLDVASVRFAWILIPLAIPAFLAAACFVVATCVALLG